MDRRASRSPSPRLHLSLIAISLAVAGVLLILLARGTGYSSLRLLLVAVTFLSALLAAAAALLFPRNPRNADALRKYLLQPPRKWLIRLALGLLFLLFWCLTWLPPSYTGAAYYYFIGFYPLILCGLLGSGVALIFVTTANGDLSPDFWKTYLHEHRLALGTALIALLAFALIALLTAGLHVLAGFEPYWYGAGVPILAVQVLIAAIIGALALRFDKVLRGGRLPLDSLLFLLIWLLAAILWAVRPVPESFWVTGPLPPNHEFYPFSDAAIFDLGSQFALIGQGIFNRMPFDRALYMSFLVYLHSLGGQDYQRLMAIQAALFAVFPALLYVVGRQLHSRSAGLVLATLVTLRGLNSLAASAWIDTATFKNMLTDFPAAIGVALFVVLMLSWLESPWERPARLVWAGGVLGLASLLRPHVLTLLPLGMLLAVWAYRPQWKRGIGMASVTAVAFLVGVAPWLIFGPSSGSLFALYGQRVRDVIALRYPRLVPAPAATIAPHPVQTSVPAATKPAATAIPTATAAVPPSPPPNPGMPFAVPQFLHNLVTASLIFPDTPEFLSVRDTVKQGEAFWRTRWDGAMSATAAGMLMLSLVLLAFGLGIAFQRNRWRALLPIVTLLLYASANAAARTSGGRYLVPIDWILICYFSVAVAELLKVAASTVHRGASLPLGEAAPPRGYQVAFPWRSTALTLLALALIGTLIPLAGILYPRRYAAAKTASLLAEFDPYAAGLGLLMSDLTVFTERSGAVVLQGRILYPRAYAQGAGEPVRYPPWAPRNYPRTSLVLIGPEGYVYVILAGPAPTLLPNVTDAIVVGCGTVQQGYRMVDAVAILLPQAGVALGRNPAAPLHCPMPEPVCDNNGNCR